MSDLSLTLLGPFQAYLANQPLPRFRTSKVQALLAYLVTEPGPHGRETLMQIFWPGMPERSARHNLRQVLYYLRGAIPAVAATTPGAATVPLLLSNRQTLQLNPEAAIAADIYKVDTLIKGTQAHDHLDLLNCAQCREALEDVVNIYQGDFLAGFYLDDSNEFEDWAQIKREAYRRRVLDALEVLTNVGLRRQEFGLAQTLAEQQLEIDNLRESSYRQLIRALALSGRREEALAVYESCRRLLAEEMAMEPSRRTTELYEQIIAGDLSLEAAQTQGIRGYEIKEEIGSGAYGTIHRAIQPAVGREVAVKVIHRKFANNGEFIRRFDDEAQMIARLEHPYVVPLYDYWRDPDGAYLVMRYLKGGSLLTALSKGAWELPPAVRLIEQIAAALAAAHQMGIVHRDIKPANILLDEEGNAYLSDFGIAYSLGAERVQAAAGAVLGTPDYISPEQILNEGIGPQSDQYSLGAVLFETLSGEKPFGNTPLASLVFKHLHEPFPFLGEISPDFSPEIDHVLQKATAKRPEDRYENILEMADAFCRAALGEGGRQSSAQVIAMPIYNPYKGLRAFQESDADDFFGRDELVERITARLAAQPESPGEAEGAPPSRFLALVGPSGSGKSSVVKAGLIPALREGAVSGSENWYIAEMVPGTHPLEELEMALWPVAVDPPPSLVAPMQRDVRGMLRTLRRILPDEPAVQLLLFIDQFEELFTLVKDEARRDFFIESLMVAVNAPRSPLRVITTLRADFYDRPLQLQMLGQTLKQATEIVLPLNTQALTWAIREPARHVGVSFETGLAETIVADVVDQPGTLPLLQYALTELFERRQNKLLTRSAYELIGGVQGALSRRAEAVYNELDAAGQRASKQLFLRLVNLGEGGTQTRRRVRRADLTAIDLPQMNQAIDEYVSARLLILDRDPLTRASTVEVAHEALLQGWSRLANWLTTSLDDLRLQQQLTRYTGEWQSADLDSSYLLHGSRLSQFEQWAESGNLAITENERRFLTASLEVRAQRDALEEARRDAELETVRRLAETESRRAEDQADAARRLRRRAQILAAIVAISFVLAVTAAMFARRAQVNAELAKSRELTAQSRELAAASLLSQNDDPELSLLLAMHALSVAETDEGQQALHLALLSSRVRQRFVGHEAAIQRVSFSPDGQRIALAAHGEGRVTVWDASSGRQLSEFPIDRCCWGIFFDTAGELLGAVEPTAEFSFAVWDVASGERLRSHRLPIPTYEIGGYYVSPDWDRVAIFQPDNSLSIWDLREGSKLFDLPGHSGWVELEFSKDGRFLVTYDNPSGRVLVWDAATGERMYRIDTGRFINDHAVSPDGRRIALAVDANDAGWEVHIWELARLSDDDSGAPAVKLSGHPDTIRLIDFSADGRMLASASRDGTSRVWDVLTGETVYVLAHGTHVRSLAFHPDNHSLLTGDLEGIARVWDITPQGAAERLGLSASAGPSFDADISSDGQLLVTGGRGSLWQVETGTLLHPLSGHSDTISAVAFRPGSQQVASAGLDGVIQVWDARSAELLYRVVGHSGSLSGFGFPGVLSLEFHPSGHQFATAGADGIVRVWDSDNGGAIHILTGHDADLSAVAYSPNGDYLATGQASGQQFNVDFAPTTIKLWDSSSGEEVLSFNADHGQRVWGLAFSPDGQYLATVGTDFAVKLWALDLEARRVALEAVLSNHANTVFGVAFSPDGRLLATATADEVRVWDVASFLGSKGEMAITQSMVLPGGPALAFNAESTELITGGRDGLIRAYILESDALLRFAASRLTRWWRPEECLQFLHTEGCPPAPDE